MKKLFTLAAALLASFSLWAADPDFESYDWSTENEASAVAGNHDGIVVSYAGLGSLGNVSGHWYIPNNQNLKNSDSEWKYFGVSASSPIDSIAILYCPNGTNKTTIAWVAWGQNVEPNQYVLAHGETTGTTSSKSWDNAIWETINLSAVEAYTVYTSRSVREFREIGATSNMPNFGGGQTINILGIRVWLKETKTVVSTEETITAITVNGDSLSAAQIAKINDWHESYEILHTQAYATAPTVKFSRHTVITYDDASTKVKDEDIEVVAEYINDEFTGEYWQAALVGTDKTFKVDMFVATSAVITYMDGETVLGYDTIAAGSKAVNYAQYESKELATFGGWYNDAALTDPVDLSVQTFNANATIYGKFTKAYAQSINIEQLVLDYGKGYDIQAAFAAANIAYKNIDALDSLNDEKTARNEPYLGLKIKKEGGYIACNLRAGDVIRVKFGYVENTVLAVAGNDTLQLNPVDKALGVLEFTAQADSYVKLQTTTGKTVVIKQIMINDTIKDVTLPDPQPTLYTVTLGTYEHGTVAIIEPNADNKYAEGDTVRLTVTPDAGYELEAISLEGIDLAIIVEGNTATFVMPKQNVTVLATFKAVEPQPTLYTVTIGACEHGTVAIIEPNAENKYAEGTEVRLSVTPDEGYEVETVKLEALNEEIPVVDGVATFNMPAQDVVVLATFKEASQGFDNIDASLKATKRIINGKLFIEKNGKTFDITGAELR